ncbi:Gfo/Idh/MocA family oxidoreductase [Sciscionella marina]|uniref:Gfo/Idh/MocA family oxidoreductase n=1 Tax=Sciscionella marina TaxID=508770 RepID=UPI0003691D30|nr:Gfo/Idh/MocA family oxidoreductase [Sciscionella marina]
MSGKLRIGLAGLGRMGRIHATNLASRCARAELATVFDVDSAAVHRIVEEHGVTGVDSFDRLLETDIDAVAITTPTGTHAELAVAAARAGKHVFCEKPLSLDREAAVRAIAAVEAEGVAFQIGFHRRFDPDWVAATERIQAGELGEIALLRTSLRDMAAPRAEFLAGSGGLFLDVTVHDLDTARWMAGEIIEVSAHGSVVSDPGRTGIGDVDTAVVVLRFANGALGVIDNSRTAGYGYECSTEVLGSLATVRIDHPQLRHYEWRTPGQASTPLVRDFEQRYPFAYAAELDAFADAVRTGTPVRAGGSDALAAFDLATAAARSWREGRAIPVRCTESGYALG